MMPLSTLMSSVTNEEKRANAAAMRKAFDAWLEENGLTADPAALTEVPDPCEGRFDTLAGAIAHIDHILPLSRSAAYLKHRT